ncbi:MAG: M55 family metallopeptidase [Gemmatimonadota bacterium]|nr:MAG: M55 family metallopeptidase [Gemmatimonadota bacterium]
MARSVIALLMVPLLSSSGLAQPERGLKVFISVDMEGITGVVNWEDVSRSGKDYDYFRGIMTREVNAAIEGALAAGATEIVVRDSHGSARNILPESLNENARLLRDWSGGPKGMMEGIDGSYDAVVFVGYHAKAGTPDALLEHTWSGSVTDFSINGVSLPEAGINALIAGSFDVPVVFVAGDKALCDHVKQLFGEVETVAVKEGMGSAGLNLHPEISRERIRAGVEDALRNLDRYSPYKLQAPYTLLLKLKNEEAVHSGAIYPGARRTGDWEITYTAGDIMAIMYAFGVMLN